MTIPKIATPNGPDDRPDRLRALALYGLLARWEDLRHEAWIDELLALEEEERGRRSLERRLRNARIGRFKTIEDFDWTFPRSIDREAVEDLLRLDFLGEHLNVVLLGPNGVGKTTLAQNIAYRAVLQGQTVRFTTASELLHDLSTADSPTILARRMRRYLRPRFLVVDEIGYLSYTGRHADLLFDVVNRRSVDKSTLVTTNRPFAEWNEVFPNSACVVALVDRLVHRAEIQAIDGDSYRRKEADERAERKRGRRRNQAKETGASGEDPPKPTRRKRSSGKHPDSNERHSDDET